MNIILKDVLVPIIENNLYKTKLIMIRQALLY